MMFDLLVCVWVEYYFLCMMGNSVMVMCFCKVVFVLNDIFVEELVMLYMQWLMKFVECVIQCCNNYLELCYFLCIKIVFYFVDWVFDKLIIFVLYIQWRFDWDIVFLFYQYVESYVEFCDKFFIVNFDDFNEI